MGDTFSATYNFCRAVPLSTPAHEMKSEFVFDTTLVVSLQSSGSCLVSGGPITIQTDIYYLLGLRYPQRAKVPVERSVEYLQGLQAQLRPFERSGQSVQDQGELRGPEILLCTV